MGLTPKEKQAAYRARKRATAPPDKTTARVPDPVIESSPIWPKVTPVEYWMIKALDVRIAALEDAIETLRTLVAPPKLKPTVAELRQRILPPPVLSDAQRQAAAETQGAP